MLQSSLLDADGTNLFYRGLRRFAQFWMRRFFRNIRVSGLQNVEQGAVIFAMNHPNNLVDSLLVACTIPRKIHFLATTKMFRNRIIGRFLRAAGVIPVFRKTDEAGYQEKNKATFEECYAVLKSGGAIGIYPEGITHGEPRVKKIKTGAARIALEAGANHERTVKLIPVGLNFTTRKSFRDEILIRIGPAIATENYIELYRADPFLAVNELTHDLQRAIEKEIVHIELPQMESLMKDLEEVYREELQKESSAADSIHLSQRMMEAIQYFNSTNPDLLRKIQVQLARYQSLVKKLRLQDSLMSSGRRNRTRLILRLFLLIAGLPAALWGFINHYLPYILSRTISRKWSKRETDYASVRVISGVILYSLFYAVQIYFVWRYFRLAPAIIYALTLPAFGAFAHYYSEKFGRFRDDIRLFLFLLTRRQLLNRLKRRREKLVAQMDAAKETYLNARIQA